MRIGWLCAVLVATLALVAPRVEFAVAASSSAEGVLPAGHSWTHLASPKSASGEFSLDIFFYGLQLGEDIYSGGRGIGTDVWFSTRVDRRCSYPRLTMKRNGNLVLHCGAHNLWSTHTQGTGNANHFQIRNSGNLVVVTKLGRVVWSSHSGRAL